MKKAALRKFDPYLSLITIAIHLRMLTPLWPKGFSEERATCYRWHPSSLTL